MLHAHAASSRSRPTRFDATHLHLLIAPPKELEIAVFQEPSEISGLVNDVGGIVIERVLNEDFFGQIRLTVVAMRAVRCPYIDLSNVANPHKADPVESTTITAAPLIGLPIGIEGRSTSSG